MEKYGLGWRNLNVRNKKNKGISKKVIIDIFALLIVFYLLVGFFSIIAVGLGEDIPYMPFWHAPWGWLFKFLGKLIL